MLTATQEKEERIDGASRQARLRLYSTIDGGSSLSAPGEHAAAASSSRATTLGLPHDREVIDEDLGKSGASSDARYGFQRSSPRLVWARHGSCSVSTHHDWRAIIAIGISCSSCACSSACSSQTAKGSMIRAPIMTACYSAYRGP
jgi:hypothetical protein